jgi:hypothetical protein
VAKSQAFKQSQLNAGSRKQQLIGRIDDLGSFRRQAINHLFNLLFSGLPAKASGAVMFASQLQLARIGVYMAIVTYPFNALHGRVEVEIVVLLLVRRIRHGVQRGISLT